MKSDSNPSIVFGLYTKPEKYQELLTELKTLGVGVREFRFIDVEIPLDNRYNKTINFFKEFIQVDYWRDRNPLNMEVPKIMGFDIKAKALEAIKKMGLTNLDIKNADWKPYKRHKLLWTLAVPIFYQDQTAMCETQEEKENMEKLKRFASDGYENDVQKELKELKEKVERRIADVRQEANKGR